MSKLALIILVIAAFTILVLIILFGGRSKERNDENTVKVNLDRNSAVNIYKDEDSFVRVEYTSFEDRPRAVEIFPDFITDLPAQEGALDREFWDRFASFKDAPFEEQQEMLERLRAHGFMGPDAKDLLVMKAPTGPDGNPVTLAPDPTDDEAYERFFTRPFTDD